MVVGLCVTSGQELLAFDLDADLPGDVEQSAFDLQRLVGFGIDGYPGNGEIRRGELLDFAEDRPDRQPGPQRGARS